MKDRAPGGAGGAGAAGAASRRCGGVQPCLGGGVPGRVGEREQVDAALVVVEGDQPVAEHERGVGQRRPVHERASTLGLELVAEVAREAAGEVERQLRSGGTQTLELARAVVEDALPQLRDTSGALDRERPRRDVVAHDLSERAVGRAHEGEAREPGLRARAVEPDGVLVVAVERDERRLRVAPSDGPVVDATLRSVGRGRAHPRAPVRAGEVAEVAQQRGAVLGRDRLGVELDAPHRPLAMLEPHHDVVGRPRRHAQGRRHGADGERVVAHGREALRDAGEHAAPVVVDLARPAVHDLGRVADRATGHVGERLVAEADAEQRHFGPPQRLQRHTDVARMLGPPRARGDDDVVHRQRRELLPRLLVVADDDRLLAVDLAQQVEEVEGEGVVVVDQQRAHRCPPTLWRRWLRSAARPSSRPW